MSEEPAAPPAAPAEPAPAPAPEPILGKFKSQDELVKAYQELEKKQSQPKPPPDQGLAINQQPAAPVAAKPLNEVIQGAGFDVATIAQQFGTTGQVDDKVVEAIKLARPGVAEEQIRREAEGELAKAELRRTTQATIKGEAAAMVGGEEQLQNLLAGAKDFVPAHEIAALNKQLNDPLTYKGALMTIQNYQQQQQGTAGSRPLVGGRGVAAATGGYTTNAEWYEAAQARAKDRATPEQLQRLAATDPAVIQAANRPG